MGDVVYHYDVEQNTDAWNKLRRGILTASEIKNVITPKEYKLSAATGYLYDFCRQRLDDMPYGDFATKATDRGHVEEEIALGIYGQKFGEFKRCGFVENTRNGFKIGCSPDALIGDDGLIEVKSFTPNVQFRNIVEESIDPAHMLQVQFQLLVTERSYCKFISHSSGTHQMIITVLPDKEKHEKIKAACSAFYDKVEVAMQKYRERISDETRFTPTPFVEGLYNQTEEMFT